MPFPPEWNQERVVAMGADSTALPGAKAERAFARPVQRVMARDGHHNPGLSISNGEVGGCQIHYMPLEKKLKRMNTGGYGWTRTTDLSIMSAAL